MTPNNEVIDRIRQALEENPGAVLEDLAKQHGVTTKEVLAVLPASQAISVAGERFEEIMREMTTWGELTLVVNTGDLILEARGHLPEGSMGQGYYNLHGKPIGGHLKADNCGLIAFVSRKLFASDTHSVQFYNRQGDCMFKIYLGRDAERQLIPEQVERFRAFRDRIAAG